MTNATDTRDREMERQARNNFNSQGFMQSIGATMTSIGSGRCELVLPYKNSLSQQHGYFHGGIIATLADVAGGYAAFTQLEPQQTNVTVEFKLNFLSPGTGDRLIAEAKVIKSGRTLTICQTEVRAESPDGTENLCATALATYMAINDA